MFRFEVVMEQLRIVKGRQVNLVENVAETLKEEV